MVAAVIVSRMRRIGTVVQSFKVFGGSSEVATAAAVAPPTTAVAATTSLARERHKDLVAMPRNITPQTALSLPEY